MLSCSAEAYSHLGTSYQIRGQLDEALFALREAVRLKPSFTPAHSNLLLCLTHAHHVSCDEVFSEHVRWGEQHAQVQPLPAAAHDRTPHRRLRIGYVSPDLREHAVARFIEPVLAHHTADAFEVFAYAEVAQPDAVSDRLRSHVATWRSTCGLHDRQVAEMIRNDRIDVLIDLAGHTALSRLAAFAYRPAPVQVSYLGYPNTTGLRAIDYRLTDAWADPPEHDRLHTEQLIRLPHGFLCFRPSAAPPVAPLPALERGYVTFGSFNRLNKLNEPVLQLWAKLLRALPTARLLLKTPALSDTALRESYADWFVRQGISRERVELQGFVASAAGHLEVYDRVDIALDPFPYSGTTTSCDALWMGVPLVTLLGPMHAGRVGLSLLAQLGLTDWVARDPAEYLQIAQHWAQRLAELAALRSNLRRRFELSSLRDEAGFTRTLEATYRTLWQAWCAQDVKETEWVK